MEEDLNASLCFVGTLLIFPKLEEVFVTLSSRL